MVQFSKRDDGIGSRIRAISGRFTRRDAIYLLRGGETSRWKGSKKWLLSQFIKLPNLPNRRDGLRGQSGFGQMRIKSPAWWDVGGLVGALHRRHVIRRARTCGEDDEGLYSKGGEATPQPAPYPRAASGTGESDKGAKGSIRGARRRFILA